MPIRVLDLAATQRRFALAIDFGAAYELLLSLCALTRSDASASYAVGAAWFSEARRRCRPGLRAAIDEFASGYGKLWGHLLGLAWEAAPPKDASALLRAVERAEPLEVHLHLLGYYLQSHRGPVGAEAIHGAAAGDAAAQREMLARSFPDDATWQSAARHLLAGGAERAKADVLTILRGWYDDVFEREEQKLMPVLARDARAKEVLSRALPAEQMIEVATNGVEYAPEPGITGAVLVPTVIFRPWVLVSEYRTLKIFCYPVDDDSVAAPSDGPPAHLVRAYKALADDSRLRILRLLSSDSFTLQQLATRLGLAKSTVHHHLAVLRSAGLVRVTEGEEKRYALRRDRVPGLSELLEGYLGT